MNDSATLWWDTPAGCIRYIEQTLLPGEYRIIECRTIGRLAEAIRRLEIRGAPALGVAGGYGVALAAATADDGTRERFMEEVERGSRGPQGYPPDRHQPRVGDRPGALGDLPGAGYRLGKGDRPRRSRGDRPRRHRLLPRHRGARRPPPPGLLHGPHPLQCRGAWPVRRGGRHSA